jgi:ankyrin repeat protein
LNKPNHEGSRALHWAALNGRTEIVKALLAHGACPTLRNHAGFSAATLAEQTEHLEVATLIYQSYDPEEDDEEGAEVEEGEKDAGDSGPSSSA